MAANLITVAEYIGGEAPAGRKLYILTAYGLLEVTGYFEMPDGLWLRCGKANAGFGLSFAVHPADILRVEADPAILADKIGPPVPWDEHEKMMAEWFSDDGA